MINNVILFAQYYKGAMSNKYFVWREHPTSVDHLTNWNSTVEKFIQKLPKYFSSSYKQKVHRLTEQVMFDKISPAQFRFTVKLQATTTDQEIISKQSIMKELK